MIKTAEGAVPACRPLTKEKREEELKLMTDIKGWREVNVWPFCHVKQPMTEGWPQMGCLWDGEGIGIPVKPIVYDFSFWSGEPFDKTKIIASFNSFDEMIDAGWIVD